jgi:hypothetical protein
MAVLQHIPTYYLVIYHRPNFINLLKYIMPKFIIFVVYHSPVSWSYTGYFDSTAQN